MVKAVEANTDQPWVVLYVKRWLVAPIQHSDGSLHERNKGTPQGGLCEAEHNPPLGYLVNRSAPLRRPTFALVTDRKSPFARMTLAGL